MANRVVPLGLVLGALTVTAAARSTAADPEKGKAVFEKCAACHALDETKSDGPTLKGIFGRKAASMEDPHTPA